MKYLALIFTLCLAFTSVIEARTWIVDEAGSGDFLNLREAIDAASDGDVIIIRPGVYSRANVVDKSLSIVGSGVENTRLLTGNAEAFRAVLIPKNKRVSFGHCTLESTIGINVSACEGRVVVSDVVIEWHSVNGEPPDYGIRTGEAYLGIFTRCYMDGHLLPDEYIFNRAYPPGVLSVRSTTAISQGYFFGEHGRDGSEGVAGQGGAGIDGEDTELYLSDVSGIGGKGGKAHLGGVFCNEYNPAAHGGYGLRIHSGTLAVLASRATPVRFIGGPGGDGGPLFGCDEDWFPGADGGDGIHVDPYSHLILSGSYSTVPGEGGVGDPDGGVGQDVSGSFVQLSDPLPTLTIGGSGAIGDLMNLTVHGAPERQVSLIVSDNYDKVDVQGVSGFPLFAIPGGSFFRVYQLGKIPSVGRLSIECSIPEEASLIGMTIVAQAFLINDGQTVLSNVVAEVFRDKN